MDIIEIFQSLQNDLKLQIQENLKARDEAQIEANSHGGAKVSRYDTFKEEAQYLVDGYKKKILDLESDLLEIQSFLIKYIDILKDLEKKEIRLGSLVTTESDRGIKNFYLYSPSAGGKKITFNGLIIFVITPISPMGKILLGKKIGDEINIGLKQKITSIL